MSNRKNSIRNLIWGLSGTICTTIVAFLIPRLFIVNYGSEVNGLLSSIGQIYVYLGLLEAGVGSASTIALYKTVGCGDQHGTNAVMSATHYFYRKIGCAYACGVLIVGVVYPLFLDTTIPYHVCALIIILQGGGGVISYLFSAKYSMLIRVYNKSYITNNLQTVLTLTNNAARIILLLNGKSIIAVQSTYLLFNVLQVLYLRHYVYRNYPWVDLKVKPDFDAISQRSAVLVHQVSSLVFSHTDVLILTFVCGLKTVSIYSIYATVYGMVSNVIGIVSNSVYSVLGQTYNRDRDHFIKLHDAFETYYIALTFGLFSIANIFILPFIRLYTDGADIDYIDWKLPVLFGAIQLLTYGRVPSHNPIGFAAKFRETQWRAWLETIINLVVSFLGVFKFGIYGVLLGTIASLLYRANDIIIFANKKVLNRSAWPTYRRWITNILLFCGNVAIFSNLPLKTDTWGTLILNGIWVAIVVLSVCLIVNSIVEPQARKLALYYAKSIVADVRNKHRHLNY